ncbi:MAG: hypothetical protein HOE98_09770 [Rhodospirillaceae bacterium]|nr:hypothetical protein [Rhodospirillaceae bacterium]MBT3976717.1 hypothetical protein [Rhodospirillaceae bacterium]MBT4169478.1 hypothetical protein [Rhodospirillaceae bacterium]MBT4565458.1 hypothetical protein [Rhodospirillaceae bacterium]MBT4745806.1 hypothetical protein [Rhodospirillaceae bacterium]
MTWIHRLTQLIFFEAQPFMSFFHLIPSLHPRITSRHLLPSELPRGAEVASCPAKLAPWVAKFAWHGPVRARKRFVEKTGYVKLYQLKQ